jgi:glutamate dehydrogenase
MAAATPCSKPAGDAYKLFIRHLLVGDRQHRRRRCRAAGRDTVRHDGDDPYFVVAADKGTATFSDTANALSQEQDFWLDDAFASGGSAGYDHKKMGITARGAWEAVKRHFREMDIDIQTTPFTAAGRRRHVRRRVRQRHAAVGGSGWSPPSTTATSSSIPIPTATTSFAERKRLFDLGRSSWQDYDTSKLIQGRRIISADAQIDRSDARDRSHRLEPPNPARRHRKS